MSCFGSRRSWVQIPPSRLPIAICAGHRPSGRFRMGAKRPQTDPIEPVEPSTALGHTLCEPGPSASPSPGCTRATRRLHPCGMSRIEAIRSTCVTGFGRHHGQGCCGRGARRSSCATTRAGTPLMDEPGIGTAGPVTVLSMVSRVGYCRRTVRGVLSGACGRSARRGCRWAAPRSRQSRPRRPSGPRWGRAGPYRWPPPGARRGWRAGSAGRSSRT